MSSGNYIQLAERITICCRRQCCTDVPARKAISPKLKAVTDEVRVDQYMKEDISALMSTKHSCLPKQILKTVWPL